MVSTGQPTCGEAPNHWIAWFNIWEEGMSEGTHSPPPRAIDDAKLQRLLGQMLGDLGGAASVAMVRMGDALGLYRVLHSKGAMTSAELAREAKVDERYVREWLSHQAASNYLSYDPAGGRFELPPEQAMVFADESSPVYMMGAFDLMVALQQNQPKVQEAFKSGGGVAWGDLSGCLWCATARFFRPGYQNNLVQQWLPALGGVVAKLERGAEVADVGCGYGWSTVIMAKAFPKSRFVGYDYHEGSIEAARAHAREHGVEATVRFEVATAKGTPVDGRFDLVTFFDCLHDMGDPTWTAAHVKRMLKPDGTWMVVEPMAGNRLEDNLNPVGRLYYAGSTMICVPTSLSQEVGAALGAQAGEAKLREVITAGGFGNVHRAAETPFNMVLEARP
jgi:2-polyprenyl-3-methyl-5-hydroxy-6-metoxy-1,4-benzoquinol methylase